MFDNKMQYSDYSDEHFFIYFPATKSSMLFKIQSC